jgi:hypothetical protein
MQLMVRLQDSEQVDFRDEVHLTGVDEMAQAATSNERRSEMGASAQAMKPAEDIVQYLTTYAKEKPDVAALWCFGIGFVLGWKLKPW